MQLRDHLVVNFFFAWHKRLNFGQKWGLSFGFGGGAIPWRNSFEVDTAQVTSLPFNYPNLSNDYIEFIQFPLSALYRNALHKNLWIEAEAGLSLRYILIEYLEITHSYDDGSLQQDIFGSYSTFDNRFLPNFHLGTSLLWRMPHYHLLQFSLMYNYSPNNIIFNEHALFPASPDYSTGQYFTNGSYLGLSVGYIFTKAKKIYRRMHWAKTHRAF
ncbi:MAG: hypothetical protein HC913_07985 [Microscillaceae bacterium]|nr:hypothetical protein [Microscillaceae bacterium]